MSLIVIIQIIMTYFGGAVLRCFGLNINEWIFVLLMAITIIPVDIIRKLLYKK